MISIGKGVGSRTASARMLEKVRPSATAAGIQPWPFDPKGKRIASHWLSKSRPMTSSRSPLLIVPSVANSSPGPTCTATAALATTVGTGVSDGSGEGVAVGKTGTSITRGSTSSSLLISTAARVSTTPIKMPAANPSRNVSDIKGEPGALSISRGF